MRPTALHVAFAVLIAASGFAVAGTAQSDYSVSTNPSVDTPDREVTFDGETYEVSQLGRVDPGDTVSARVTAPPGDAYDVLLYDADRDVLAQHRDPATDTVFFDVPEDDQYYPPGTYVVAVSHDGVFQAVTPLVISGYRASVDAPASAEPGSTVTVDASLETIDDREPIDRVRVVIGNDETRDAVTLSDDGDGEYSETFSLDGLPEGEYSLYVVVQGSEEVLGRQEVLGVSDARSFSIEADGATGGSSGDGTTDDPRGTGTTDVPTSPSTPTDPTGTTTDPTNTNTGTTDTATTTDDPVITPNDPSPTATSTTTPGQPLGVLPALVALLAAAILALRRR